MFQVQPPAVGRVGAESGKPCCARDVTAAGCERRAVITSFGFHASHEQIDPTELLAAVRHAEGAGFTTAMCSDHFSPWSARQGQSSFAWSWLGAALQATSLPFGVVSAPGQRYHPAVLAQAISTLATMYEERLWVALGSGEYCNEHITGDPWPRKELRNARLAECVAVIRALLAGEEVSHDGRGPLILQVHLSIAASDAEATAIAYDQWRSNIFPPPICWDLDSVEAFDAVAEKVRAEDMAESVLCSADPGWHAERLHEFVELGFDTIYLHHVGQQQRYFVDTFGDQVLPRLAD